MPLIGTRVMQGRKWAPGVRTGGVQTPSERFVIDPALLPIGQDPRYFNSDYIVIPRGNLIGIRPNQVMANSSASVYSDAVLTLADGCDPDNLPTVSQGVNGAIGARPLGFSESNIFRKLPEHEQWFPVVDRQATIQVPYVQAINDAYGQLKDGDRLTAYFGTVNANPGMQQNKGKLCKWTGRRIQSAHAAAGATIIMPSAILPAFPPRIISATNAGAYATIAGVTLAYTSGAWTATFSGSVTDVLYDYGQGTDQVIGEVVHLEAINAYHEMDGWLKWVTDDYASWDYAPMLLRVPTTAVTNENPKYLGPGNYFKLANAPIAPHLNIIVTLAPSAGNSFQLTDLNGNLTTISGSSSQTLILGAEASVNPAAPYLDYTFGNLYSVNPVTGELYLSAAVSYVAGGTTLTPGAAFNQITVSYSYETSYRMGRLYSNGVQGLTDGMGGIGIPGTPTNLDVAGSVGALRALIY